MEETEQEKRGEGVKQNGAEVTGGQNENEKLDISSPKEGDGSQAEEQDEARKSSVEQEMERYLRSELSKQEQSSSEMVRSLLGKSPKKEEKQIEATSPKKEERQGLEPVEGTSSKLEEEQFVTNPTSDQE